jgi:hypothetical protein
MRSIAPLLSAAVAFTWVVPTAGYKRLRATPMPLPEGPICDTDALTRAQLLERALGDLRQDFRVIEVSAESAGSSARRLLFAEPHPTSCVP